MIQFNTPEWFFLIPLLLAAGWKYRRLRLASPLRLLLQACLLLAAILSLFGFTRDGRLSVAEGLLVLVIFAGFLAERQPGQRKSRLFWNGTNMPGTASDWWISRNPPCSGDAETPSLPGEPPERTWNRPWPIPWP